MTNEAEKTAVITGYTGVAGEVEIPSSITAAAQTAEEAGENQENAAGNSAENTGEADTVYTVVGIGENALKGNTVLTSVTIPNTVTALQYEAFCGCENLRSVSFQEGSRLETIEAGAFRNAVSLESFACPRGVKSIGQRAFAWDRALVSVSLNEGLTEIGGWAFMRCGLKSVDVPDSVTVIPNGRFASCEQLSSASLGKDTVEIGDSAFSGCSSLTGIELPSKLQSIGTWTFANSGLQKIDLPASVVSVGIRAFYGCAGLSDINIGNGLTYIPSNAFAYCGTKNLTIGNKVKAIQSWAFSYNKELTSVTLPANVTDLQYKTFNGCSNLVSISLPDTIEHMTGEEFHNTAWYNSQPEGEVYLGRAFYYYKGTMPANTTLKIQEGTNCVAGYSCADQPNLTEVILPEGLKSIEERAFLRTGLKYLYIPASVKQIDGGIVGECTGYLTLPDGSSKWSYQTAPDFVIYGYSGTAAETYASQNSIKFAALSRDIAACGISGNNASYTYTGEEIKPEITVTNQGLIVSPDNYTVAYQKNVQAGTAAVTITGKGVLTGTVTKTFQIKKESITKCSIQGLSKPFDYTGKAIKPSITVKLGSRKIAASNYKISYKKCERVPYFHGYEGRLRDTDGYCDVWSIPGGNLKSADDGWAV